MESIASPPVIANTEQFEHWNNDVDMWVAHPERIDAMLGAFDDDLLDAAGVSAGVRVLDIGCGTGSTTLAAARRAAPGGAAHGVDLSAPMLDEARRRAAAAGVPATFEQADAQVHEFSSAYDAVISRFGVMFFANPTAAFANFAEAVKPGGRLAFVSWQPLLAQQWMLVMGAAVMPYMKAPPQMGSDGPGMFGLSDPDVIRHILRDAGWSGIEVVDLRKRLRLGGSSTLDEAVEFFGSGMLTMMLGDVEEATRRAALDSLRAALAPHVADDGVRLEGAVWLVTAERG